MYITSNNVMIFSVVELSCDMHNFMLCCIDYLERHYHIETDINIWALGTVGYGLGVPFSAWQVSVSFIITKDWPNAGTDSLVALCRSSLVVLCAWLAYLKSWSWIYIILAGYPLLYCWITIGGGAGTPIDHWRSSSETGTPTRYFGVVRTTTF